MDRLLPIGGVCCCRLADFSGGGGGSDLSVVTGLGDGVGCEASVGTGGSAAVDPLLVVSVRDGGFELRFK